MAFIVYDLVFLIIFCIAVALFLYRKRGNLKREMKIAFLYKTQWGVKLIKFIGKKYNKQLGYLRYVILGVGYFLMAGILYLIARSAYIYAKHPFEVTRVIKAPPIAPVIPYFPTLFGLDSFFPPFYFTYFIVALSVVGIVHEFSHGIYMVYSKVKIKSTGILFLGPLLGAFVEQDEADMEKASKFNQMAILGAGVFANVIFAGIFLLMWVGLFYASFTPTGAVFDVYVGDLVNIKDIKSIGGIDVSNPTQQSLLEIIENNELEPELILDDNDDSLKFILIEANEKKYYMTSEILSRQLSVNDELLFLYIDYPAINEGLRGTIIEIEGNKINEYEELANIMDNYSPGDEINIKTNYNEEILDFNIVLDKNPDDNTKPMIGIGNSNQKTNIAETFAFFKNPATEYTQKNEFLAFLYYLAFWTFLINLLVGFFNMLPLSILDGGRFFMLTVWGITKNKKRAEQAYRWMGKLILLAFLIMMIAWFIGIIQ